MSRIVVTGASGAIGSRLIEKLISLNHEVITPPNQKYRIQEKEYFTDISDPETIDFFYHLAAKSFVPDSWEQPADFVETNVLGTSRVIEFCAKHEIKLVFISSYVYGVPDYLPIDEKHALKAVNPYAMTKIMGEKLCRFFGDQFKLKYVIIRPFNVYGSLSNKKLLIPEIINKIHSGKEIEVKDLSPKRDYIYIDDLIDFMIIVNQNINNQIYNIGSGESHSVSEVIGLCQKICRTKLPVISNLEIRQNEINETIADTRKAWEDFNWRPAHTLEEGLEKMIVEMGI